MGLHELYLEYHPLLFSIAYRMLGTVTDAEDIVQDVYLQASIKEMEHVENAKAYLCKMVTNRCIDHLKSAQKKRLVYIGPWLPEPLIINEKDPFNELLQREAMSIAVLFLLEKLNPIERAVFILREVLEYDYTTIAEIIERKESNCRKIFSRVKDKFPLISDLESSVLVEESKEEIIHSFVSAMHDGNLQQLEKLLKKDVTIYSDGGGKVSAALIPIKTRFLVLRFIKHLLSQVDTEATSIKFVNVNGQSGLLIIEPDNLKTVISFKVDDGQIQEIYIVRNPDKLKHII